MNNLDDLWLISGRVCGDDDDAQHIVEASSKGSAVSLFTAQLQNDANGDEDTVVIVVLSMPLSQAIERRLGRI
mgnify:CR=1 FL=1